MDLLFFYHSLRNLWEASQVLQNLPNTDNIKKIDICSLVWDFSIPIKEIPKVCYAISIGSARNEISNILNYFLNKGSRVVNKINATHTLFSKSYTYNFFTQHNIPFPKSIKIYSPYQYNKILEFLEFPIIAKHDFMHVGRGVFLLKDFYDLKEFIKKHYRRLGYFIFQEYIPYKYDLRVLIIGDKVLGAISRKPKDGDFRANISLHNCGEVFELSKDLKKLALRAAKSLELDICGVDILIDENKRSYVIEINKEMQFRGFQSITGINVGKEIANYLLSLIE